MWMRGVHDGPSKPGGGISSLHVLLMLINVSHATYCLLSWDPLDLRVLIVTAWQKEGWFWYTTFLFTCHASLPLSSCLLIRPEIYPFCCLERDNLIPQSFAFPAFPLFTYLFENPGLPMFPGNLTAVQEAYMCSGCQCVTCKLLSTVCDPCRRVCRLWGYDREMTTLTHFIHGLVVMLPRPVNHGRTGAECNLFVRAWWRLELSILCQSMYSCFWMRRDYEGPWKPNDGIYLKPACSLDAKLLNPLANGSQLSKVPQWARACVHLQFSWALLDLANAELALQVQLPPTFLPEEPQCCHLQRQPQFPHERPLRRPPWSPPGQRPGRVLHLPTI